MATNSASMAPPSEVPMPLPRRRGQRIPPQVWNEQRPRFQKLYVDLDMSLPETMEAMENTYNFYASEKQYKTKIKEWNFTKYVNEVKMENMLRKEKRRRTQEGKETAFTLNDREVEHEKLNRFQKRRKLQDHEIGSSTVSTASRVQYYTPPGQSPYATLAERSPECAGSETGSSLAPTTITSGSHSTSTSGSVLLRLTWNGLDLRALRDMERRAKTLIDDNPTDALEIFRQVLAGYEHLLGPDQDDVHTTLDWMGRACLRLSNNTEAEALFVRAISGHERVHGPDDTRSLISVANLAQLYKMQYRFEDSEVLYVRAIKGLDHTLRLSTVTLRIFSDLASVYLDQGLGERASIWYKRAVAGYRSLGAGHEDELLRIEINLSLFSYNDGDPATESLLIEVLAKCEARNGENHAGVFVMLYAICRRYWNLQACEKFELYDQRLRPFTSKVFGKDETIDEDVLYFGIKLACIYSEMGRYEEAESLFMWQKLKTDGALGIYVLQDIAITHAEHYIRQSKWEDAERLLLQAKALENQVCQRHLSADLVAALEDFRIGSGREAGALLLAQRTPGPDAQGSPHMPSQTVEDINAVTSVEFQQPLGEVDWSNFLLHSPSAFSLPWSPQQPPAPPGELQPGLVMNWENSDMMGMYDVVE